MRTHLGVLAVGVVVGLLGSVVLSSGDADAAKATRTIDYEDTSVVNNHGSYARLPDGGYAVECCGLVRYMDGGIVPVDAPCVRAEAGPIGASFTACLTAWRVANAY